LVEHSERRRVTTHIVDVDECSGAAVWTKGVISKFVRSIVVVGEFISRGNQRT
jgi:hypothetical protein